MSPFFLPDSSYILLYITKVAKVTKAALREKSLNKSCRKFTWRLTNLLKETFYDGTITDGRTK